MKKSFGKTDPALISLINDLKSMERDNGAAVWRDVANRLEKPRKNWAETNLSKLSRHVKDGEVILVPGKVLSSGSIDRKIVVAAYNFSKAARTAIVAAGGRAISIANLMIENPQGSNVRIMR